MTKTIDITLALRWEENGVWQDYSSNFDKKLKSSKFRVFTDAKIPGLPRTMNLPKAHSFAAHHKGEVVNIIETTTDYVGGATKREAIDHVYDLRNNAKPPESGERQVAYIIRVPTSSIVYGKLTGHIEGLEISDKATNRYVYSHRCGEMRVSEAEHLRIQSDTSGVFSKQEYSFVRYLPRSTETGGAA
ncbi:hypothetical protein [Sphingomonas sp. Leaf28]|uniref:hypothetical protein n=1 Tax=Sphingomonas sp. Leaf28 TaxID=1735695 RepID=UPI000A525BF3|nr:hypothetical protein [Sphingomonas sp. Leaf28]